MYLVILVLAAEGARVNKPSDCDFLYAIILYNMFNILDQHDIKCVNIVRE